MDCIASSRTLQSLSLDSQNLCARNWRSLYRCVFQPSKCSQPTLVCLTLSKVKITKSGLTLMARSLNYNKSLRSISLRNVTETLKFFIEAMNIENDTLNLLEVSEFGQPSLKNINLIKYLVEKSRFSSLRRILILISERQWRWFPALAYEKKQLWNQETEASNTTYRVTLAGCFQTKFLMFLRQEGSH